MHHEQVTAQKADLDGRRQGLRDRAFREANAALEQYESLLLELERINRPAPAAPGAGATSTPDVDNLPLPPAPVSVLAPDGQG